MKEITIIKYQCEGTNCEEVYDDASKIKKCDFVGCEKDVCDACGSKVVTSMITKRGCVNVPGDEKNYCEEHANKVVLNVVDASTKDQVELEAAIIAVKEAAIAAAVVKEEEVKPIEEPIKEEPVIEEPVIEP